MGKNIKNITAAGELASRLCKTYVAVALLREQLCQLARGQFEAGTNLQPVLAQDSGLWHRLDKCMDGGHDAASSLARHQALKDVQALAVNQWIRPGIGLEKRIPGWKWNDRRCGKSFNFLQQMISVLLAGSHDDTVAVLLFVLLHPGPEEKRQGAPPETADPGRAGIQQVHSLAELIALSVIPD